MALRSGAQAPPSPGVEGAGGVAPLLAGTAKRGGGVGWVSAHSSALCGTHVIAQGETRARRARCLRRRPEARSARGAVGA